MTGFLVDKRHNQGLYISMMFNKFLRDKPKGITTLLSYGPEVRSWLTFTYL